MRRLPPFPSVINETSVRTVAAGVLVMSVLILAGGWMWLTIPLAYGFLARVASGPTLSPLAQFATRVVTPRWPGRDVAGTPKRFAQAIGATLSTGAVLAYFGFGSDTAAFVLVALIAVAATLESVFSLCLGCHAFALLMKAGAIPESVCLECADVSGRLAASAR